jgi:hypothetical protein
LKKSELGPFAGQEPTKRIKADLAVFGRSNVTRRVKLLDEELLPSIEERPERQPYTLTRRNRRPKRFQSPTGEVVWRFRGGAGFTPIYAPWSHVGLARVRGTVVKVAGGWAPYPRLWAAREPGPGPYVLRAVAELAMDGKDIAGTNHPLARDYADWVVQGNQSAQVQREESPIGPQIDDEPGVRMVPVISFTGEITDYAVPANGLYRMELDERKRLGRERTWVPGMEMRVDLSRKAKTSEHRSETSGEYGPETKLTRDGRIMFGGNGPLIYGKASVEVRGVKDYSQRRLVSRNGKLRRVDAQMSVSQTDQNLARIKPGPKPVHGITLDARLRKIRQRCRERGKPFVLTDHLKETV